MNGFMSSTLALTLLLGAHAAAAEENPRAATAAAEGSKTAKAVLAAEPVAEDWGIWNRAPRRAGRDPLLALDQRDRAPSPEPIDAAARLPNDGTADDIDLNAWDNGRFDMLPPPSRDDGT
jgi:hypothetical protein